MELPHLGQVCCVCKRNDYLPFKCSHCDMIVCVDHKTSHGSKCPLTDTRFEYNSTQTPAESLRKACDYCKKITLALELSECPHCKHSHCLYHRHQVQHACVELETSRIQRENEAREKASTNADTIAKLKVHLQDTHATGVNRTRHPVNTLDAKQQALARRVRIMRIKQSARGPANVLTEDKIHFEVKFHHNPQCDHSKLVKDGQILKMFATRKHTVGRLVDWAAVELDLTNKNHLIGSKELVFIKCQYIDPVSEASEIILNNQLSFGQHFDGGDLADGDELILSYR